MERNIPDRYKNELRWQVQQLLTELSENEKQHNSYQQEMREQECIRRGNLEGLLQSFEELEYEKIGVLAPDPVRNLKNLGIVVIAISSRSAIAGGLGVEIAFSMSDIFIQKLEKLQSFDQVSQMIRDSQVEFCLAVRDRQGFHSDNPVVNRCKEMIMQRINRKLKVRELAEELNLHPDYLSQMFVKEEGVALSDYITEERIRFAQRELIFTDRPYNDIAISLGFSSQSHFGKVFKKQTGLTPGQYREQFGKK